MFYSMANQLASKEAKMSVQRVSFYNRTLNDNIKDRILLCLGITYSICENKYI